MYHIKQYWPNVGHNVLLWPWSLAWTRGKHNLVIASWYRLTHPHAKYHNVMQCWHKIIYLYDCLHNSWNGTPCSNRHRSLPMTCWPGCDAGIFIIHVGFYRKQWIFMARSDSAVGGISRFIKQISRWAITRIGCRST